VAAAASSVVGPVRPDAATAALLAASKTASVAIPEPVLPNPWVPQSIHQLRYGAALMSASLSHVPEAADERARVYPVRQPHATHASFPSAPEFRLLDSPPAFERLSQDTLFFIFYFAQSGSYQAFLAARELRRNQWRYSRAMRTWVQRHGEATSEALDDGELVGERGSILFFDEPSWSLKVMPNAYIAHADIADDV
jgi:CCR4-NOT transcription complex subunit 3